MEHERDGATSRTWLPPRRAGAARYEEPTARRLRGHRIDEQIAKAFERKVWLPSGGSLVIDRTEAMRSSTSTPASTPAPAATSRRPSPSNNLEAAEEIVRQLRLRDIGGIIVVDFIDMVLESNRELVMRRLHRVPRPRPHPAPGRRGHLARPGPDDPQADGHRAGRGVLRALRALPAAAASCCTTCRWITHERASSKPEVGPAGPAQVGRRPRPTRRRPTRKGRDDRGGRPTVLGAEADPRRATTRRPRQHGTRPRSTDGRRRSNEPTAWPSPTLRRRPRSPTKLGASRPPADEERTSATDTVDVQSAEAAPSAPREVGR